LFQKPIAVPKTIKRKLPHVRLSKTITHRKIHKRYKKHISIDDESLDPGCIFYQLAFKEKVFPGDWKVFEYAFANQKPRIHYIEVGERIAACVRELVYRTLEIDWWKRPAASDVLQLIDSLSNKSTSEWVFYISEAYSESEYSSSSLDLSTLREDSCDDIVIDSYSAQHIQQEVREVPQMMKLNNNDSGWERFERDLS
jgi:hypothetical protein